MPEDAPFLVGGAPASGAEPSPPPPIPGTESVEAEADSCPDEGNEAAEAPRKDAPELEEESLGAGRAEEDQNAAEEDQNAAEEAQRAAEGGQSAAEVVIDEDLKLRPIDDDSSPGKGLRRGSDKATRSKAAMVAKKSLVLAPESKEARSQAEDLGLGRVRDSAMYRGLLTAEGQAKLKSQAALRALIPGRDLTDVELWVGLGGMVTGLILMTMTLIPGAVLLFASLMVTLQRGLAQRKDWDQRLAKLDLLPTAAKVVDIRPTLSQGMQTVVLAIEPDAPMPDGAFEVDSDASRRWIGVEAAPSVARRIGPNEAVILLAQGGRALVLEPIRD